VPGMGRSLPTGSSLIVSSFHTTLLHQFFVVVGILLAGLVAFNVIRTVQYRRLSAHGQKTFPSGVRVFGPEPPARRVVRIGFGLLWILDGLLQLQSAMPLGLPSSVVQPSAASSPAWVRHVVNSGTTIWSDHPVQAASAVVWIQLGLGIWLLASSRGRWSRLAGAATAAWGLLVWVFGEAFGGIFAPGLTWLFGAPGAVLFYCVAGLLVALPERAYATPKLGRTVLGAGGAFLIGMAVLQAWPGRGYWQGRGGTLHAMVTQMAQTSQPGFLSSWVSSFADFDATHGWAVNLFVVVSLAAIGTLLLSGRRRLVLGALVALTVLGLADWVLVEDLGFLGGVDTDPNSMLPMLLLFATGYIAMTRLAEPASDAVPVATGAGPAFRGEPADAQPAAGAPPPWWERATIPSLARPLAAVAALGVVLVGTGPMALAAANRNADPILTEALDGTPNTIDNPAPPFALTDQHGQPVSLSSLRGHVVALTFLDPVCTSDCPLIAQEFRQTDESLQAQRGNVDFVAVVANPIYRSLAYTNEFDRQEGLTTLSNWYFLTGSVARLTAAWNSYGVQVETIPDGAMVAHNDIAFVIDRQGHERDVLVDDPGPTQTFASSFSSLLHDRVQQVLGS
jgi:cytochrome oxidase Cu insertion factor (SCO1/SenC/PrrC family)